MNKPTTKRIFPIKKSDYTKPDWAVKQVISIIGVVYDICKHNQKHINEDFLKKFDPTGERDLMIHKCKCGCCSKVIRELNGVALPLN